METKHKSIGYSMCWEDPEVVKLALDINQQDKILSVASGGENLFSILLKNPSKVFAIDSNPYQIYLVKLKVAAIKELSFEEFIEFLGLKKSKNRLKYFNKCKHHLTEEELSFWEGNMGSLKEGVIHCGKFERYLKMFRIYVLSLVLSKNSIKGYLSSNDIEEQKIFFDTKWDNWRWKILFKIFFSKTVMQKKGRDKKYFKHSNGESVAKQFYSRSKRGLTNIPTKSNHFIHYILTGKIPYPLEGHPYLDEANFLELKKLFHKLEFINSDIFTFLRKQKTDTFSKFNLSDIFESMTQEQYEEVLLEIVKSSEKEGRICYWNNLIDRSKHPSVKTLKFDKDLSSRLQEKDRVFFYSKFILEKVNISNSPLHP